MSRLVRVMEPDGYVHTVSAPNAATAMGVVAERTGVDRLDLAFVQVDDD